MPLTRAQLDTWRSFLRAYDHAMRVLDAELRERHDVEARQQLGADGRQRPPGVGQLEAIATEGRVVVPAADLEPATLALARHRPAAQRDVRVSSRRRLREPPP